MEDTKLNLPGYAKLALILMSLSIIIAVTYLGQHILVPLLLSLFFAILLRPLVLFLNFRLKFPHIVAVTTSVVLFVLFVAAIVVFVSWQISDMTDDWIKIKTNLTAHFEHTKRWIKEHYQISYSKQQNYINHVTNETMKGDADLMRNTLNGFTDTVLNTLLIPVYTFLILLYRNLFIKFLYKVVDKKNETHLKAILVQVKTVVQSYIVGLLLEMGIVGLLTGLGLILLGVKYAILLALITAILNLIPYVGILAAALITILATLGSSSDLYVIVGIIILNTVVQLLDNNIIVPKIVGNKVSINALVSILGVIIGGALAGISGMILSIPLIAVLKVIFDHVEPLKPWGILLGNTIPTGSQAPLINKI